MSETPKMRGLGDAVARVTGALGIQPKRECGCKKRQEALNRMVPFERKRPIQAVVPGVVTRVGITSRE